MAEQPKYTPEGLPVVTKETSDIIAERISTKSINIDDIIRRIGNDNPGVINYINEVDLQMKRINVTGNIRIEYVMRMLILYEALRVQAETNRLTDMYKGTSSK